METFSASLAICAGNSPAIGEFPTQRPVTRSFDVFFALLLNKRLSKQWWGWWFETPSCPLWRHCNDSIPLDNWIIDRESQHMRAPNEGGGTINWLKEIQDDVIKWKHFPRFWPFVRGIHRSPVDSSHKGQWRRVLIFSLISAWTNGWANNRDARDSRCQRAHYDVTVMKKVKTPSDLELLLRICYLKLTYSHLINWTRNVASHVLVYCCSQGSLY